jgi:arsenite transporter
MVEVLPSDDVVKSTPAQSETTQSSPVIQDIEKQRSAGNGAGLTDESKSSIFKSLGWLDRFLAVWIFLAMLIGILLGNFVDDVGPALQKGEFVGVSVPIGMSLLCHGVNKS